MYAFSPAITQNWRRKLGFKVLSCLALVCAADILFYHQQSGWTLGLFALGLLLAVVLHQPHLQKSSQGKLLIAASGGLGLSLIEQPTLLAQGLYVLTLYWLVLLPKLEGTDARRILRAVLRYSLFTSFLRVYRDSMVLAYARKRMRKLRGSPYGWVLRWMLPVICTLGFAALFAQANPIIAQLLGKITLPEMNLGRILWWLLLVLGGWSLLHPKLKTRMTNKHSPWSKPAPSMDFSLIKLLFNEQSITLSLVLFNGLFLMQNLMDVAFLWSGAGLPEGLTYAEYAHRGAYPLMVTALLAAFFILVAFKAEVMPSTQVRTLIYAWVGQNMFLVFSSMLRLKGYVDEYSLTYLRVSALIWMVLVVVGLSLIVARICLQRSNQWLVNRNAIIVYVTLYVCCFANFGGFIASYNLAKFENMKIERKWPDLWYIENNIGVEAIPALAHIEKFSQQEGSREDACKLRQKLQAQLNTSDWHAWTFRNHRIAQFPTTACDSVVTP